MFLNKFKKYSRRPNPWFDSIWGHIDVLEERPPVPSVNSKSCAWEQDEESEAEGGSEELHKYVVVKHPTDVVIIVHEDNFSICLTLLLRGKGIAHIYY